MTPATRRPGDLRVAVLMGGPSSEHPISVKSGKAIADGLRQAGCGVAEVVFRDAALPPIPDRTDVVFPALHGAFGEDGAIQQLLEDAGVPYVGCGVRSSRIIIDKEATKRVLEAAGLRTPCGLAVRTADVPCPDRLPVIVKPSREGSTIGLTLVRTPQEWPEALAAALACDDVVLVEEFVAGVEITVGLLEGKALPVIEIQPPNGLFDYDAKYVYTRGETLYHCPPRHLDAAARADARRIAETAYQALEARDLLRVDMIVDERDGAPSILEANSMPGFTATSLLPKAAGAAGVPFPELCLRLVRLAVARAETGASQRRPDHAGDVST